MLGNPVLIQRAEASGFRARGFRHMNIIKKAGCIGALVAGLCAPEQKAHADYSSLPHTPAAEIRRTYQVEKKETAQADKDKMVVLGYAAFMGLVGMGFMILYAWKDKGDYR